MPQSARSRRRKSFSSPIEPLEGRRLMSAVGFGDAGTLIRYPATVTKFPTATGAGQTVAVIDSGIDYTHPSLGGGFGPGFKVVGGHDFVDDDDDPMDTFGHGTEVAGIIAAKPAGSSTYQGIAPGAKLVALRVGRDEDDSVPDSKIEDALKWVIDHRVEFGITVVNISYGQGNYNEPTVSTVYGDEIVTLTDAGVVIVAASGNDGVVDGGGIESPAADPNAISVGSVNEDDSFSSFGQRGQPLGLLAPGDDVLTTLLDNSYGLVGGTSYAAPIVAGTAALMRGIDNTLTPHDTLSILRSSGVQKFDGGSKSATNITRRFYPRLDLLNALNLTTARKPGTTQDQALVGQYGNQSAIAVDAQGVTHLVYYDAPLNTMKYATRDIKGQWSNTQIIDNSLPFQGYYLSMALDTLGQPHVAYFDGTNGDLKYASYTGTVWTTQSVDIKNSTGAYPSLVFDRNGYALITYYRKTTGDLRAARRGTDGSFTLTTIASTGDIGRFTAAAVSANGQVGVAFEDTTHGWLGYGQMDPKTGTWATTTVDKKTRGTAFLSMAFNTEDQRPYISYYDAYPADLKVAQFKNRGWQTEVVAARGATGLFTNLFFSNDQPYVAFFDKRKNDLLLAVHDDAWTVETLYDDGGRFATVAVDRTNAVLRYAYFDNASYIRLGERSL